MLRQLTVNNVGLVSDLDLRLTPGLTVLTGESGAGKSLLLAALGLVLGTRASAEVIKAGASRAEVIAEFDLSLNPQAQTALETAALCDPEQPNRALVRRVVSAEGRSRAFINDVPVTLATLKTFAEPLVDIHGQQESYRLSERDVQRSLLDDFGCQSQDRQAAQDAYRTWRRQQTEAERLRSQLEQSEDRKALLTYQLEELETLALQPGEFAAVETKFRRLAQIQSLKAEASAALSALDDNPAAGAARALRALKDENPHLDGAREYLASATELMGDAAADLRRYLDALDDDSESVADLEARLSAIHEAARKHKVAPEALEAHVETIGSELSAMSTDESAWRTASDSAAQARASFEAAAKKLSRQRKKAASTFARAVSEHMQILGIAGGTLAVELSQQEGEHGFEAVEFLLSTNPEQAPKALKKIASGGEQSRISLAIQIVAAEKTALPCLVLDEADVGVGGTTADVIGRLLRRLASHTQILCVTHAPQVAALGQQHLRVFKSAKTGTHIEQLSDKDRLEELARMLAGAKVTAKTRTYAATLLEEAAI